MWVSARALGMASGEIQDLLSMGSGTMQRTLDPEGRTASIRTQALLLTYRLWDVGKLFTISEAQFLHL